MIEKLTEWANAGDSNSAYHLAQLFKEIFSEYIKWLEKAAEGKNFQAMKEFAEILRNGDEKIRNTEKAVQIYKELVTDFYDVESMEILVDMCAPSDTETLNLILDTIDKRYNEIYLRDYQILGRVLEIGTRRHNECTIQTLQAIERRRISSSIRKLLAGN